MGNRIQLTAILLSLCVRASSSILQEELETCLQQILGTYFKKTSLFLYDALSAGTNDQQRPLLLSPLKGIHVNSIIRMIEDQAQKVVEVSDKTHEITKINRYQRVKPQSSIFFLEEGELHTKKTSQRIFQRVKETENWDVQGRSLIVVQKTNASLSNSKLASFAMGGIWHWSKAVNVVVMIVAQGGFSFHTWYPYRSPDCFHVRDLPIYEEWREGTFQYKLNLYPEKIKGDLEGCPLRVAAADCLPYSYNNYTDGFEAALVRTLAEHLNFKMYTVSVPDGENMWMNRLKNGSTAGAIGLLNRQAADLAFACLMLSRERYNLGECLPTYFYDSLTWFVPTPDIKSHAANVFEAFPGNYWIVIFITTVAAMCVFVLIMKIEEVALMSGAPESVVGASLRVFAMAISSPIAWSSKNALLRIFSFLFAIYSLHITTIYQASLYNLYRSNSYSNVYKTLEDAINNNLFVWLRESTKELYPSENIWEIIMQEGNHGYIKDLETAFDQVAHEKTAIALFIKSTMQVYIKEAYTSNNGKPQILFLQEPFSGYPVTLYLAPGHPIFNIMAKTVQTILEAGLVERWLKDTVHNAYDDIEHLATNVSLEFEHISGAIMFYGALVTLAVGIFLVEKVYWKHGPKKNLSLPREELNLRRQLMFRAVIEMGRDRLSRFRKL